MSGVPGFSSTGLSYLSDDGFDVILLDLILPDSRDLETTISELRRPNRKVLKQQKSVIEEERLKGLLQITGATAHEINQPLIALLGNIELMKGAGKVPSDLSSFLSKIELAGKRIADIASRVIQEGAFDYFPKDMVSEKSLFRSIANTQRKIPAEKRDKAGTGKTGPDIHKR